MDALKEGGVEYSGRAAIERYIDLLTGSAQSNLSFRTICDVKARKGIAQKLLGSVDSLQDVFRSAQAEGHGVFAVVNAGGQEDADIREVRAVFIDADDTLLVDATFHVRPDFLVVRDAAHWHAYWLVCDIAVGEFRALQKRLAQHYGTDRSVCNPSRVMRVPGFAHQKDPAKPQQMKLIDLTGGSVGDYYRELSPHTLGELRAGLPELPEEEPHALQLTAHGVPITEQRFREILSYVDPTMEDDHGTWAGMTLAVLHGQLPLIDAGNVDWEQLADDWNSGELCRQRTGKAEFEVSTYFGKDEMLESAAGKVRKSGPVIGLGTFVRLARLGGYQGLVADEMELFDMIGGTSEGSGDNNSASEGGSDADHPISAAQLASGNYPPPSFLVDGLILRDEVNLLYGDGGTGKTTLALQFAVAIASGQPALGFKTQQMPVLLVLAEDGPGETKRRLEAICGQMNVKLADLPLHVWPRPGQSCVLADVSDGGEANDAPFMAQLRQEMAKIGPCLVVLDALADFANVDEIKRQPVNTLFKRVLGSLCREFSVTLLMLGHPSKSGMTDGSQYSGSTAFNNAVRQRLTLTVEKESAFDCKRTLKVAKANYAALQEIDLYLIDGFFTMTQQAKAHERIRMERNWVFDITKELLERGEQVVHLNGNGLHPEDIAAAVADKHGIKLSKKQVRDHLKALRIEGRLGYQNADNSKRGVRAGYMLPPAA